MFLHPLNSGSNCSDSSDSDMETLHLLRKRGSDGQYKINNEASEAIKQIAERADRDRDFTVADVDLAPFGQKIMDLDFNARALLEQSHDELQSLISFTSDENSDYGTMSSSASAFSFGSVGVPTVKRLLVIVLCYEICSLKIFLPKHVVDVKV